MRGAIDGSSPLLLRSIITLVVIRLVEQEVRGQLLVLVAREVRLSGLLEVEAQPAQTLDGIALLLGDGNSVGSRRERGVFVAAGLAEQLQELVLVLRYQLGQLRVAGAELLQDRLQHLRLLLDYLT